MKIEKGIQIPKQKRHPKSVISAALQSMEIGDSFLVQGEGEKLKAARASVYMAVFKLRKHGIKIKAVTRSVNGGVRVWRVEDRRASNAK